MNSSSEYFGLSMVSIAHSLASLTIPEVLSDLTHLTLHDPIEGGFSVDHVVVCFERNVFQCDVVVIAEGGLVDHGFAVHFDLGVT